MKTVRFSKLVEDLGRPEPYTLWVPPEKDSHFQAALKAHRVMTVHQENRGGAADFGEVGFAEHVQGSFLVFPKSLKRYEGRRVVGIKYDLLEAPPAIVEEPQEKVRKAKAEPQPKSEPKPKAQPKPNAEPKPKQAPVKAPPAPPTKFEPLRVFNPEVTEEPARPAKANAAEQRDLKALTREVRKAMTKLEQGHAVAAYQILEQAVTAD